MSDSCQVCKRDPKRMNSAVAECSHVDCPSRERAWSNGTKPYAPPAVHMKEGDTTRPLGTVEWRNVDDVGEQDDA